MTMHENVSDLTEHCIHSETVYRGGLLHVKRDAVRLPDGSEGWREYVRHPGAVVIIPVLQNGRILFERQYRYPVRQTFLELPAGKIEAGEDILETARRELLEETGYTAQAWDYLGVMHPCIGYSDERIEIFLARDLSQLSEPQLDEGEFLEIFDLSLEEVRSAIREGRLTDAKTMTALYRWECQDKKPNYGVE